MQTFGLVNDAGGLLRKESHVSQPADPIGKDWRWLPDNPPAVEVAYQVAVPVLPVPANATELPYTVINLSLAKVAATAKRVIDDQAEAARLRIITAGSGQALAYKVKAEQAQAVIDGAVDGTPLIDGLVGIERRAADGQPCETREEVAAEVIGRQTAWLALEATIDAARLTAKYAIADAPGGAEIMAARDAALAIFDSIGN